MGTLWPLSNQLVWDNEADLSPGAKVYFHEGGTTTPLVVFIDYEQTMEHSIPVVSDGNGRWPAVFVPFGPYKYSQFTSRNVQIGNTVDNIPNIDPTPPETDVVATSLLSTGDVFFSFIDGTRAGAVRCNGRSIGNGSSAGTERANDDTQNLFIFLWNNVVNAAAPVSGGRGASASEDFAANKTIGIPDLRAAAPVGLPTMGSANNGLLASAAIPIVVGTAIDPGSILGATTHTLLTTEIATHFHGVDITSGNQSVDHAHGVDINSNVQDNDHTHNLVAATVTGGGEHTHSGTTDSENRSHNHGYDTRTTSAVYNAGSAFGPIAATTPTTTGDASQTHTHTFSIASSGTHSHDVGGTTDPETEVHHHNVFGNTGIQSASHTHRVLGNTANNTGAGGAHNNLPRATLGTYFIKL